MKGVLSGSEYGRLVEHADDRSPRHGFTVYLLGHTGIKRNAAANFTPSWFDPEQQLLSIPAEQDGWSPKSPKQVREIPLSPRAAAQIAHYLKLLEPDALDVAPGTIYERVKTASTAAGMRHVAPSTLRHTFANRLLKYGLSHSTVAQVLGFQTNTVFPRRTNRFGNNELVDWSAVWPLYEGITLKNTPTDVTPP